MITISGQKFRQMMICGANLLEQNKKLVDEMNVFPVPDGDTGTNMSLTVTSAIKEMLAVEADSVEAIAKALSSGALRGARGNSGVIVSQLFRGIYKGIKGNDLISAILFVNAIQKGVDTAYKAVMMPKEGTILTVAREGAKAGLEKAKTSDDLSEVMSAIVEASETALAGTPELLPVLKEAGVVDAGGQGLVFLFKGFLEALSREDETLDELLALSSDKDKLLQQEKKSAHAEALYCVEFELHSEDPRAEEKIRKELLGIGRSVKTRVEEGAGLSSLFRIQARVHTNRPGEIISRTQELGTFQKIKIENRDNAHEHLFDLDTRIEAAAPRKEIGFIAISVGEGLERIFKELGVDCVLSGGQTMNPSTEDILQAASKVNADHIVVLPNNKNIILAAEQAAKLLTDKTLHVLPTTTVPQGISAMIGYMNGSSLEENLEQMSSAISAVVSGSLTYAVRDTRIGEFSIHEGDFLAMKDGEICYVGKEKLESAKALAKAMITDETSIFTIYCGQDATFEEAASLEESIHAQSPQVEVEVQEGGQPIYAFLLSAE